MRALIHALMILFLSIVIFVAHLFFINFLPTPFNSINIVFLSLILFLIFNNSGNVVWFSFILHLLLDMYSVTSFGIYLFAGTISILFEYWFYRDLFTNRSIWALVAMTASGLLIFRVLSTICILFVHEILWQDMLLFYFFEFIFTVFGAVLVYSIINFVTERFKFR